MRRLISVLLLQSIFQTEEVFSQAVRPNIRIHPNGAMQQFEVAITTHPMNPNIVLVSAVTQDTAALMQGTMGWYYTTNGGASWSGRDTLSTHTNLNHFMGDPTVAIDVSGHLFVGGIYNDSYIFVDRSTSGGSTWFHTAAYANPVGYHRPHLIVNPWSGLTCREQNDLYLSSTGGLFSVSTDTAKTFSTPTLIAGSIGSWRKIGPRLAIDGDCGYFAAWAGYDASSSQPIHIGFNSAVSGTWGTPRSLRTFNIPHPTMKNVFLYSTPSIAYNQVNGDIYIVYPDRNPTTTDIFLIRSSDGGSNWSNPIKVNQDNSNKDQWMPSVAVDPYAGNLFVVYYDSRNFPNNDSAQVYISSSRDRGVTFKDTLVSDTPFLPAPIRAPWANNYMGQYISIAALNRVVWPCWMDNRTGIHQVYVARIADSVLVSAPKITDSRAPSSYVLNQNFPNPFNPSTEIEFSLPRRAHVSLTIFDVLGREIATLVSEELEAGSHRKSWNAEGKPSGVYLYRLLTYEFSLTKKLLLVR